MSRFAALRQSTHFPVNIRARAPRQSTAVDGLWLVQIAWLASAYQLWHSSSSANCFGIFVEFQRRDFGKLHAIATVPEARHTLQGESKRKQRS